MKNVAELEKKIEGFWKVKDKEQGRVLVDEVVDFLDKNSQYMAFSTYLRIYKNIEDYKQMIRYYEVVKSE